MDKQRLQKLIEAKPLTHQTDSVAEQALKRRVNEQQELIAYLAECLAQQAGAILDIRRKMIEHKNAIEGVGNMLTGEGDEGPSIVMPPQSELIGFK